MNSPSEVRVKVDGQGRMVLPRRLREDIVSAPGEVLVRRTPDGLLLTPVLDAGAVGAGPDGLPVLSLGRRVTNAEVLAAIEGDRADRRSTPRRS